MIIPGQFWFSIVQVVFREEAFLKTFFPIGVPMLKLSPAVAAIFEFHIGTKKNLKFVEGPSNEHSCTVLALIIFVVF